MEESTQTTIEQFVDYLVPELTPYESSIYLYLLRNSFLRNGTSEVRVGKRTIASGYGKGARGESTNYAHVTKILQRLEQKGYIKVGETNRLGTLYTVTLPKEIPSVAERIAGVLPQKSENNYFTDANKRRELFERDKWICQYCGEKVSQQNATLDHFIPKSKGGDDSKDNLRTCCLVCNGIKSGKTYEEAAPFLLKSIQERRARSIK
jgi:hypothetical protein